MNFEDAQLLRRPVIAPTEQRVSEWAYGSAGFLSGAAKMGFGEAGFIKNDPADGGIVCRIVFL